MTTLETLKAARLRLDDDDAWRRTGNSPASRAELREFIDGAISEEEMTQQKLSIVHMIIGGNS